MRVLLAQFRKAHNLTQAQLARRSDIAQGYYSEVESGVRCPSPEVSIKIAKVLKVKEQYMFRVFYKEILEMQKKD